MTTISGRRAAILALLCLSMLGCTISSSPGTKTPVSLTILPANPSLFLGLQQGFLALVTLHDGTTQDVTAAAKWSSSQTAVATIDKSGLLKTLAQGTTTITATYLTLSGTTTVKVTPPDVIAVNINPAAPGPVAVGAKISFTAAGVMSDGSPDKDITKLVKWTSSDTAIATVDPSGTATALAVGVVQIAATYGSQQNAPASFVTLMVNPVLQSIVVSPSGATIAQKTAQQFTAIGFYGDGSTQDITRQATTVWDCSPTTLLSFISKGLAKAGTATGSCSVTAAVGSVTSAPASLTVSNLAISKLSITPANPNVPIGLPVQFHATGEFTSGSTVVVEDLTSLVGTSWASSNKPVAAPPTAGATTGLTTGSTTITATFAGKPATTTLKVTSALLSSLSVTPASAKFAEGTALQLTATGTYTDGSKHDLTSAVTWKSSSTSVVGVSSSGLATGNNSGSATVTASLGGKSATTSLTVSLVGISSVAITPASASIAPGTTQQFTATATFSDKSQQDVSSLVQWNSSDPSVATVRDFSSGPGLTTGVAAGTSNISAVYGSVAASNSAVLTVSSATLLSVDVTPANPSVALGSSQQMKAVANFSDGTSQDVTQLATWASSDISVAVVDQSGMAITAGSGTAAVTAAFGGASGTSTITVP